MHLCAGEAVRRTYVVLAEAFLARFPHHGRCGHHSSPGVGGGSRSWCQQQQQQQPAVT